LNLRPEPCKDPALPLSYPPRAGQDSAGKNLGKKSSHSRTTFRAERRLRAAHPGFAVARAAGPISTTGGTSASQAPLPVRAGRSLRPLRSARVPNPGRGRCERSAPPNSHTVASPIPPIPTEHDHRSKRMFRSRFTTADVL
jgi:hypothetical protein